MATKTLLEVFLAAQQKRRSVFISYHHDRDQYYYNAFSSAFSDLYGVIQDNSLGRIIGSEKPEYVMR